MIVSYNLTGSLTTMQTFSIGDLNFCEQSQDQYRNISFGQNFETQCKVNFLWFIRMVERNPTFKDLYLNYTENNVHFLKSVPVLLKKTFSHNSVSTELRPYFSSFYNQLFAGKKS